MPFLGLQERPADLPMQQAAAAVGQNVLMNRYQRSLSRHEVIAGSIHSPSVENPARTMQILLDFWAGARS